jgi:hypothetical protein
MTDKLNGLTEDGRTELIHHVLVVIQFDSLNFPIEILIASP